MKNTDILLQCSKYYGMFLNTVRKRASLIDSDLKALFNKLLSYIKYYIKIPSETLTH